MIYQNYDINQLPFSLMQGEQLIVTIKPERKAFIIEYAIGDFFGMLFLLFFLSIVIGIPLYIFVLSRLPFFNPFLFIVVLIAIMFVLAFIPAYIAYGKYTYWITNLRIITSKGLISYQIYDEYIYYVMDVIINYSIADRIVGTCSLYVRNIDGTISYLKNLKYKEAKQIQSLILYLAQQARQQYGNVMPPIFYTTGFGGATFPGNAPNPQRNIVGNIGGINIGGKMNIGLNFGNNPWLKKK